MIGQTISHYQIKRELGRGGMGVVYLAEDLRLGRQVAIKALPREVARDPVRRKRFEQEARACAALNHSAIAAVFDLEEVGDELFIVFEFVDGEDLRALIRRGPVSTGHLLTLAQGLVRGLAAAHGAGIIHRDLKPENIRLTTAGEVKILDFGLARMQPELLSNAATFSFAITQQGSIVGTVGYMSPEQLESRELDARTDIFSLGVILYEMAAGVHPFQGESPASTIANVLTRDVAPLGELNPVQPPALDRVVRRCLAKKREERYQSAADLLRDIEDLQRRSDEALPTVVLPTTGATPSSPDRESGSFLASAFARLMPNVRRWWELHHIFMAIAILAIFPYLAWQVRGSLGGQLDLLFFFSVVILTMIHFVFRGGMLLQVAFNPTRDVETIQRLGTVTRLTHIILCLSVVLAAPKFVIDHPLLGTFFAAMVIGGILLSLFIEPWIERNAFPELARLRDQLKERDQSSPQRGARQWWLIHHLASMLVWTPMMAILPWQVREWLPSQNDVANIIVFLCIVLAIQNLGMRAYVLEVAWFHREALEASVQKMARPILFGNLALALLAAIIAVLLFRAHTLQAAGFMVMAVGATMIVSVLERNFNRYAFPGIMGEEAAGAASPAFDDLSRLAGMQFLYIGPLLYLVWELMPIMERVAQWMVTPQRPDGKEFPAFAAMLMTTVISLLFLGALAYGLAQRRMDVVKTFKRWFVLFVIFDLVSMQGTMLFLARHTHLMVLLLGSTALLYGIRYQWILAKRVLAHQADLPTASEGPSPSRNSRWGFLQDIGGAFSRAARVSARGGSARSNDYSKLMLLQVLYGASALAASVVTGRRADRFIQWIATPQPDRDPMIVGTVFLLASVALVFLFAMAYNLFLGRPGVVAFFKRCFVFFGVLDVIALIGMVKLLDPNLTLLSIAMGLGFYGIRYQWLLVNRILAKETEQAKPASAS